MDPKNLVYLFKLVTTSHSNLVSVTTSLHVTGAVDPDQEMIDLRMNAVKHKILVLSGKGGMDKKKY